MPKKTRNMNTDMMINKTPHSESAEKTQDIVFFQPEVKETRFSTFKASPQAIRTEVFDNQEHIVVPIVALVEGVIQGATSPFPELALAEEFMAGNVQAWNGRPVTLGHPQRDGMFVSAGRPDVFETEKVGFTFNSRIQDNKLKTEAWINLERANRTEAGRSAVERLQSGAQVEVSTGFFADLEVASGTHKGEDFFAVQRNIRPDHLAILAEDEIGACNWEDGCGAPRVNKTPCCQSCATGLECEGQEQGLMDTLLTKLGLKENRLNDSQLRVKLAEAKELESEKDVLSVYFEDGVFIFKDTSGKLSSEMFEVKGQKVVLSEMGQESLTETNEEFDMPNPNTMEAEAEKAEAVTAAEDQSEVANEDKAEEETQTVAEDTAEEQANESSEEESTEEPVSLQAYIEKAPAEMRDMLESGMRMHNEKKEKLLGSLKKNSKCKFTEDELKEKSLGELEKLASLAGVETDFSARPAPKSHMSADDGSIPAPPKLFSKKTEAAK